MAYIIIVILIFVVAGIAFYREYKKAAIIDPDNLKKGNKDGN